LWRCFTLLLRLSGRLWLRRCLARWLALWWRLALRLWRCFTLRQRHSALALRRHYRGSRRGIAVGLAWALGRGSFGRGVPTIYGCAQLPILPGGLHMLGLLRGRLHMAKAAC
jgi:hypothetical protein